MLRRNNMKLFRILCSDRRLRLRALRNPGKILKPDDGPAIFSTDTHLVVLHATVLDKSGHLVTNLPQSAFEVYENGKLQPIKVFKREDVPVSLGLIVDNSGSMRDKRQKVEAAALALVKESNPEDEVFIVNFNDEAYLDQDFTSDIEEMKQGLTKIDSRGGTAMRDAIRMSIDHLKEKAKKDKKVLLVVTDGNDNASMISLENLVQAAQQSETIIYAIGLLSEEERREAKRAKRALISADRSHRRPGFFPEGRERSGRSRPSGGARSAQPIHHRLFALERRARWHLSRREGRRDRAEQAGGAHPQRLLRRQHDQDDGNGPTWAVNWGVPGVAWRLTRGYRLTPWKSPYLRWRIETYSGIHADDITAPAFWRFAWNNRRDLLRYLRWAAHQSQSH